MMIFVALALTVAQPQTSADITCRRTAIYAQARDQDQKQPASRGGPADFEKRKMEIEIVFNAAGEIAGLLLNRK